jgi:hypothetical protein
MQTNQIEFDEVYVNQIADNQLETLGLSYTSATNWTCASVTLCGCVNLF